MSNEVDIAKHRLFDRDALDVKNIKFFPGTNRDTTSAQMADQVNKVIAQLEAGDYEVIDQFDD